MFGLVLCTFPWLCGQTNTLILNFFWHNRFLQVNQFWGQSSTGFRPQTSFFFTVGCWNNDTISRYKDGAVHRNVFYCQVKWKYVIQEDKSGGVYKKRVEHKETDNIACRYSVIATCVISPVISQPESVPAWGYFSLWDHLLSCDPLLPPPPRQRTIVSEWVHFISYITHSWDVWHSLHLCLSGHFMADSRRRLTFCQQPQRRPL